MGTDLPSNNSEIPNNKPLIFGCGLLIISLVSLIAIPILFYFTMAMGMGAGSTPSGGPDFITGMAFGGIILLVISPVVVVVAGGAGIMFLIHWGVTKLNSRSASSSSL